MSDTEFHDVFAQRLDAISQDIRKQGRAAIAAQAAAETCLHTVEALRSELEQMGQELRASSASQDDASDGEIAMDAEELVRRFIPFSDALDRVLTQGSRLAISFEKPTFLERLVGDRGRRAAAVVMAEGLRLLRAQLDDVMHDFGVDIDRATGVSVDGLRHRVVETRVVHDSAPVNTVLEVVRPGYHLRGNLLRETDVVATVAGNSGSGEMKALTA